MKCKILFSLIILLYSINSFAQYQYKSKLDSTIYSNGSITLEVENKYGNIEIIPWEKDSIRTIIDVEINAKTSDKLEKLRSSLSYSILSTQHFLSVKTLIDNKNKILFEVTELAEAITNSTSNAVSIKMKLYIPIISNIKINHKYGDVYTGDLNGNIEINISNGNLKAHDFNSNAIINVKFGNATINKFTKGKLYLEYGNATIDHIDNIEIFDKSSEIRIRKAKKIISDSKRSNIFIDNIGEIEINSSFSNTTLYYLEKTLTSNIKYGNLSIHKITPSTKKIDITAKFADLDLSINKPYFLDVTCNKSEFSSNITQTLNKQNLDEKGEIIHYNGITGNTPNNESILIIRLENSKFRLDKL